MYIYVHTYISYIYDFKKITVLCGPVCITVLRLDTCQPIYTSRGWLQVDTCTKERNVDFPQIDSIFTKKCAPEVNPACMRFLL